MALIVPDTSSLYPGVVVPIPMFVPLSYRFDVVIAEVLLPLNIYPFTNEVAPVPPCDTSTVVPFQVPDDIIPTEVKEDAVTPDPKVVPLSTEVPLIKYAFPVERLADPAMSSF